MLAVCLAAVGLQAEIAGRPRAGTAGVLPFRLRGQSVATLRSLLQGNGAEATTKLHRIVPADVLDWESTGVEARNVIL